MLYQHKKIRRANRLQSAVRKTSVVIGASIASTALGTWTPPGAPAAPAGWQYTFDDEFSGTALNGDTYINGSNTPSDTWLNLPRWGYDNINNESEIYQQNNVTVSGGDLHLTALKQSVGGYSYTSGEVQTQGTDNGATGNATAPFSQLYGKFEISAKAPLGVGFWPAFWLLPEDVTWPPEVDIFELPQCGPGYDPSGIPTNVHVGTIGPPATNGGPNTGNGGWVSPGGNFNISNFNTYAVEWDANMLKWLVNGNVVYTTTQQVPQKAMYMIMNLAMGGGWTGPVGADTPFPSELTVDYARAYSASPQASFNWNSSSGGAWTNVTGSGWNNTTYPQAPVDTANFNQSLTATQTVTLSGPITLVGLNLTDTSGSHGWNIAGGGNTLTMDSDNSIEPTITAGAGSHTVDAAIALPWLLNVAVNGTQLTLSGPISGVGSVTKTGSGVLVLGSSISASTYTGGTTISQGTVRAASSTALGPNTNPLTMSAGTTFDLNGNSIGVGDLNGSGTIDTAGGAATLTVGNGDASGSSSTFSGIIQNASGPLSLTKVGPGTLTLTGTNTFSGTTAVLNGTLIGATSTAFGSSTRILLGDTSGSNNATIAGSGSSLTFNQNIIVQAGNTGTATLESYGSDYLTTTYSGAITLGSTVNGVPSGHALSVGANSYYNVAFTGTIQDPAGLSGTGAVLNITDAGTTVTLSGSNTFTGGVNLSAWNLEIGNNSALGKGTFTIEPNSPGWNNVGGNNFTISNKVVLNGDFCLADYSNTLTLSGNVLVNGSRNIQTGRNTAIVLNGTISDSPGTTGDSLTLTYIDNNGVVTLAGFNSFDGGVTFSSTGGYGSSTLNLNNAYALGSGPFTINAATGATQTNIPQLDNASASTITLANANAEIWNGDFIFGNAGTNLNTGGGSINLGATGTSTSRTVTVAGNNLIIPGVISNGTNGVTTGLTKAGSGMMTLGGANTFTGNTTVSAGTLNLTNAVALQYSTVAPSGGSVTFDSSVTSHTFTFGGLAGSGNLTLVDNSKSANPVALTIGGNNASTTFSGGLLGAGSLTKVGAGTTTLNGISYQTGNITISSGRIIAAGNAALGSGTLTLAGGTLSLQSNAVTPGLTGNYYNDTPQTGYFNSLSSISSHYGALTPAVIAATTTNQRTNFDFSNNGYGNGPAFSDQGLASATNYAAIFKGYVYVSEPGVATFATTSDDGSVLFVDGSTEVVNNNNFQGATTVSGTYHFTTAGYHQIEIGYYQGTGGAGLLVQYQDPGASSLTTLTNAEVSVSLPGTVQTFANNVHVTGSSTLDVGGTVSSASIGTLTIDSAQELHLTNSSPSQSFLAVSALNNNGGTLDIGQTDLVVHHGNLAAITAQIANGYGNGGWTGINTSAGAITSIAAANTSRLLAVGVATGMGSLDGSTFSTSDVLVKCTYYGDTNLDGKVDGSDYSQIDNSFLSEINGPAVTGWQNGDFNYDGVVDGSDYTLIDNAFNSQGAQITAEIAEPTAQIAGGGNSTSVPEPACMALVGTVLLALLGRRGQR